jgi:predicted secreted protein
MARFEIAMFILLAAAICIFSVGCIETNTLTTTPSTTVILTQESTKLSENMIPITTVIIQKCVTAAPADNMISTRFVVVDDPIISNKTYETTITVGNNVNVDDKELSATMEKKADIYPLVINYRRVWENEITMATLSQMLTSSNKTKTEIIDLLPVITFDENISPTTGDIVKITAEGNPTTGYEWTAISDILSTKKDRLVILTSVYTQTPVDSYIVGSGGTYEWLVTAEKPGIYEFHAQYKRPWEDDPVDEFYLNITFR